MVRLPIRFLMLLAIVVVASCSKESDTSTPNPTPAVVQPDSLIVYPINQQIQYGVTFYYPGFGDWDTTYFLPIDFDQDSVVDFKIVNTINVIWHGTSIPYEYTIVLEIKGDSTRMINGTVFSPQLLSSGDSLLSNSDFTEKANLLIYTPGLSVVHLQLNQITHLGFRMNKNGLTYLGWIDLIHLPAGYCRVNNVTLDILADSSVTVL